MIKQIVKFGKEIELFSPEEAHIRRPSLYLICFQMGNFDCLERLLDLKSQVSLSSSHNKPFLLVAVPPIQLKQENSNSDDENSDIESLTFFEVQKAA